MSILTRRRWLFGLTVAGATALRLWNLGIFGVQHDAALYAVRALGWFDFLAGVGQSSPIVWYGVIPWWGFLSFHDHPPLVFAIMRLFMVLFGQSPFVVLLPFAVAGIISVVMVYLLIRRFGSASEALVGMAFLALSSYAIWSSRIGYLEGVEVLFIIASVYFFVLYLQKREKKYLFLWSATVGLALLSKYTAIFLLPAAGVYILLWERRLLKTGAFWLAVLLIPLLLTPVIIYNVNVFATRGHFDAALSSMVGMHPVDYEVISKRGVNSNFQNNFLSVYGSLKANGSLPFLLLELAAGAFAVFQAFRRQGNGNPLLRLSVLNIVFIVLMFLFAGAQARFLSIITPFLAVLGAYSVAAWYRGLQKRLLLKRVFVGLVILIFAGEILYGINTNILYQPRGYEGWMYSPTRIIDNGFAALDRFLQEEALRNLPPLRRAKTFKEFIDFEVKGSDAVIFDGRADWFSTMWHINRYNFYYNSPVVHFPDFVLLQDRYGDPFAYLQRGGVRSFWFVLTTKDGITGSPGNEAYQQSIQTLLRSLQEAGVGPAKEITNGRGQVVFKVYHFSAAVKDGS